MTRESSLSRATDAVQERWRRRRATWPRDYRRFKKKHGIETLNTYALDTEAGLSHPNPGGYTLHEASDDNLAEMKATHPDEFRDRKYGILRDRVGSGDETCYLVADGAGTWCGYCHMATTDNVNERINHLVPVGPTDVYMFDSHVFTDHRRRGLHTFAIARRLQLAHERGRTRALTTITSTNTASVASFEQFGLRRLRWLVHVPDLNLTLDLPARRSTRLPGS